MQNHKIVFFSLATLIVILSTIFSFQSISSRPVERWDEYTNIVVVDEMLSSQDYFDLKYENEPFLEKPPLWYWTTGAVTVVYGNGLLPYRIVSAVSGVLTIVLTMFIGWKFFSPKTGLLAGIILISTRQLFFNLPEVFSVHNFTSADLDGLQILFIILTMYSFFEHEHTKTNKIKRLSIFAAALFTGLAYLTKGPFGLLPAVIFFICKLFSKEKKQLVRTFLISSTIFFVIILPWVIYQLINNGLEFIDKFFLYHQFKRGFLSIEDHGGSIFYYIKILLNPGISGLFFLYFPAVIIFFKKFSEKFRDEFKYFFIFVFPLTYLVLISLIGTKLIWYLLPFYPVAAIMISASLMALLVNFDKQNK